MNQEQALALSKRLEETGAVCDIRERDTGLKAQLFGKRYSILARIAKTAEFVTPLDIAKLAADELGGGFVPAIEFTRDNKFEVHGGKVVVGW